MCFKKILLNFSNIISKINFIRKKKIIFLFKSVSIEEIILNYYLFKEDKRKFWSNTNVYIQERQQFVTFIILEYII